MRELMLLALAALAMACGTVPNTCVVGETRACLCVGSFGVQSCSARTRTFSSCLCAESDGGDAADATGDTQVALDAPVLADVQADVLPDDPDATDDAADTSVPADSDPGDTAAVDSVVVDAVDVARVCLPPNRGCNGPDQCCPGTTCMSYRTPGPDVPMYCCGDIGQVCGMVDGGVDPLNCCGAIRCNHATWRCECLAPGNYCTTNHDCCSGICAGSLCS